MKGEAYEYICIYCHSPMGYLTEEEALDLAYLCDDCLEEANQFEYILNNQYNYD